MKYLTTKRYKNYTYHVEANGDFYIYLKNRKTYAPFGNWSEPKQVIREIIQYPHYEYRYLTSSKRTILKDAERAAKESKNA